MKANTGQKETHRQFGYAPCEIVNPMTNAFSQNHSCQKSADDRRDSSVGSQYL